MGAAANFIADTITITTDPGLPGTWVNSPGSDGIAVLNVSLNNAEIVQVDIDRGTAATVDVFTQLGDMNAATDVNVNISDVQIGAVELKNGADDTRGIIKDGSTFATTDAALGVADANVLAQLVSANAALDVGPTEVTVDNTATGQNLEALIGSALETDLEYVVLIPEAAGISWADGNATDGVNPMPVGAMGLRTTKTEMDTRKFITGAVSVNMSVLQFT